jgi:ABC-2 type transport system ATP-binding protein
MGTFSGQNPPEAPMITISQLSKRYGNILAVDALSFTVAAGEVLGFLGANGAGKSTTMRMIAGFVAPTSGTISVCGHDVTRAAVAAKSCMGYLPEGAPSYGEMSVSEFLDFVADLRGLAGAHRRERRALVVERLGLDSVLGQMIETLSKGFRRRVGLAQALIHDPAVLILDEPTDGLDPNQKHEVRRLINELSKDKLVIVSTHILEEVHEVCTRAIIIADGRIVADDTPGALESRSRYHKAVTMRFERAEQFAEACREVARLPAVTDIESNTRELRLTALPTPGAEILPALSALMAGRNWSVPELHLESGRLDEVFRTLTQGHYAPAAAPGSAP